MQRYYNFRKSNGNETYMCQPILSYDFRERKRCNAKSSSSRASSGNKCDVDAQKTCSNAIIFENRVGLKLTCVNPSSLAISSRESVTHAMFYVVGQVSKCLKRKARPEPIFGNNYIQWRRHICSNLILNSSAQY